MWERGFGLGKRGKGLVLGCFWGFSKRVLGVFGYWVEKELKKVLENTKLGLITS